MKKTTLVLALTALSVLPTRSKGQTILTFGAAHDTIGCGVSADLSWSTSGCTSVVLGDGISSTTVTSSGSETTVMLFTSTTYTLYAFGPSGTPITASVTVTIVPTIDTTTHWSTGYEMFPQELTYHFFKKDTVPILHGYLIKDDSAIVTVLVMDTIFHEDTVHYAVNTCTNDTIAWIVPVRDTVYGYVRIDTFNFFLHVDTVSSTAGVDEPVKISGIKIFPNPATETLSVEMEGTIEASLYTLFGQKIAQESGDRTVIFSLSNLPPGMYLIAIKKNDGSIYTSRILKS